MSDGEVKLGLYMTTGRAHGRTFRAICAMVEKLLPNGEIKVTTPDMQDLERIVAEKDAEIERLELVAMAAAESIKEKYKIMDTQKRVIEKLKGMVSHYETCATVDRYDDEKVPCDCGLEKELAAIDKAEA